MKDENYISKTKNGSTVEITKRYYTEGNAWNRHTYYAYIYRINNPVKADLDIMDEYPRWFFDFTGINIRLNTKEISYMVREILNKLSIETPYKENYG